MKTNKPHILLLLALTALFTCCSGDDYSDINTSGSPDGGSSTAPFTITVTDGGYASLSGGASTRASEANYKTIFTDGDQIGVFAVKGGEIVDEINNLHLCLTDIDETNLINLVWTDVTNKIPLNLNGGATYYAYYPYKENLDTSQLNLAATTAAEFFAGVISEWSPTEHQSTYADYTAQDLMIAKGKANFKEKSLTFTMQHQMALVVMDLPRIEYTFTNLTPSIPNYVTITPNADFEDIGPCRMEDGTYRYLMNPSQTKNALFAGSYTSAHGLTTWKTKINTIPAGNYQIIEVDGGCRKLEHELAIGDFFMKDGTLIAGIESLTPEQQAACIGIVFWVGDATQKDQTLRSDHPDCTHGLVVALKDAVEERVVWQNSYSLVQDWLNENHSRDYLSVVSGRGSNEPLNNIQGYNNTKAIEEFNAATANSGNLVQAVSKVVDYRTTILAPRNSSNWYLPSVKELTLLCGKEVDDILINNSGGTANKDLINGKLNSINSVATPITPATYWSSTEYNYYNAFRVYFANGFVYYNGKFDTYRVRCVLAF